MGNLSNLLIVPEHLLKHVLLYLHLKVFPYQPELKVTHFPWSLIAIYLVPFIWARLLSWNNVLLNHLLGNELGLFPCEALNPGYVRVGHFTISQFTDIIDVLLLFTSNGRGHMAHTIRD